MRLDPLTVELLRNYLQGAVEAFTKLPLSAASQKKILWDNFSRLYDLTTEATEAHRGSNAHR